MKSLTGLMCLLTCSILLCSAPLFDSSQDSFSSWTPYGGAVAATPPVLVRGGFRKTFPAQPKTWYRARLKVTAAPGQSVHGAALQLRALPYPLKTYGISDYLSFMKVAEDGHATVELQLPAASTALTVCLYTYPGNPKLGAKVETLTVESFVPQAQARTPEQCMRLLGKYKLPQRDLCLTTLLVKDGQPQAAIVATPELAAIVNQAIKQKTGTELPVLPLDACREKTTFTQHLIMMGNRHDNASINSLYLRHYTLLDIRYPGPGGNVVRSLHNPYGDGHNVILAGGSDNPGTLKATQNLARIIARQPNGKSLALGYLKDIRLSPDYTVPQDVKDMAIYERSRGYGDAGYFGWNSLAKNLAAFYMTAEPRFAREFYRLAFPQDKHTQDELFKRDGEAYRDRSDPIASIYHYMGSAMILFWDLVEEDPIWTPQQRAKITDAFYRQLTNFLTVKDYTRPYYRYHTMKPVNPDRHYTWQVLTAGITARYLHKYYPDCFDAQEGLRLVHNAMKPMMNHYMAENISRFWYNTATELPARYALLFGGETYISNPVITRYPRALLMLSALEPHIDWSQNSTSGEVLHMYAYLTQDQAYADLFKLQDIDSDQFTLGQSWFPDKPFPKNSIQEHCKTWQRHAVDTVGLKLRLQNSAYTPPPFPLEKVTNWISLRTRPDDSGDFMLLDTQYNLGLRSPLHQFSMLSAHLCGFPVLRGYFNGIENFSNGLFDHKTVFFSEILNCGKTRDCYYITGRVPDRNGADWERTWLLKEGQFLLAVDKITFKRDSLLAEINNHLTSRYPSVPQILDNGECIVTVYKGAKTRQELKACVGQSKTFLMSCSAEAKTTIMPTSSDAGSSSQGAVFAITRKHTRAHDTLRFATIIRPGTMRERGISAQQQNLIALMTPTPARLSLTPDGFKLTMTDGQFCLENNRGTYTDNKLTQQDATAVRQLIANRKLPQPMEQTAFQGTPAKPVFQGKFNTPIGVLTAFQDKIALADDSIIVIKNLSGKTLRTIETEATVGALAWEPQRKHLIAGCKNEKVIAYGLDGSKRWEYLSVMPPRLLKSGQYWQKPAIPGIRLLHCAKFGEAAIFAGGCGNLEALTADGKLVKNIYIRFGAVDHLLHIRDKLYLPHAFGGGPVIHQVDQSLVAKELPSLGGTIEPNLAIYGFNSIGHAFLCQLPDGNWLDVFNGMHNRLVLRDAQFHPQDELNLGTGSCARYRNYAQADSAQGFNIRGLACNAQNEVLLTTGRALLFVLDATNQKLKVKNILQLPSLPVFLKKLPGKNSLLALQDGRLFLIANGAPKLLSQVPGEPLTAVLAGNLLVVGDKEGRLSSFRLPNTTPLTQRKTSMEQTIRLLEASTEFPPCRPGATFDHNKEDGTYAITLDPTTGSFGKWVLKFKLPESATQCRFQATCDLPTQLLARELALVRVCWLDQDGNDLRSAYLEQITPGHFQRLLKRPDNATFATLHLGLRYCTGKKATFKDVSCTALTYQPRLARIAVAKCTPALDGQATCEDNQKRMESIFKQLITNREKPDLVVFPETLLTRWVPNLGLDKGAQTIPGPHTDWLASYARKLNSNVVASLREIANGKIYNSAVVINRQGDIVGTYRKTQLTVAEYEDGFDWGTDYPVFQLDFGKIGCLICWDMWFPEAMRSLRLNGAEIIAYPIASTSHKHYDTMWKTRAAENGVFLAASISGADGACPSRIVAPDMTVLAETFRQQTYAIATVDLNDPPVNLKYLSVSTGEGEGRSFYIHERNPGAYSKLTP